MPRIKKIYKDPFRRYSPKVGFLAYVLLNVHLVLHIFVALPKYACYTCSS